MSRLAVLAVLALLASCASASAPRLPAEPPVAEEELVSKDTILAYAGDELPASQVAILLARFERDQGGELTVTRIEVIDDLPVEDPPAPGEPQRPLAILPGRHRVRVSFRAGELASTAAEEVVLDARPGRTYEATFEIRNLELPAGRTFHGPEPQAPTTNPRLRWAPLLLDTQRTVAGAPPH